MRTEAGKPVKNTEDPGDQPAPPKAQTELSWDPFFYRSPSLDEGLHPEPYHPN
jgi:hypothetical protein